MVKSHCSQPHAINYIVQVILVILHVFENILVVLFYGEFSLRRDELLSSITCEICKDMLYTPNTMFGKGNMGTRAPHLGDCTLKP